MILRITVPFLLLLLASCSMLRTPYNPAKKYPRAVLQKDYSLLEKILEADHPSLYWYTPKPKMDAYFRHYYEAIGDSMTENDFAWHVLSPLIQKIHCGHTAVSMSRGWVKWIRGKSIPSFPLYMKVWNDTMAVTGNLNRAHESVFKRGTIVTSINGVPAHLMIKYFFDFLPEDGYAENINYIRLSSNFPYFHRNIFGLSKTYRVGYLDSSGHELETELPLFVPAKDSLKKQTARVQKIHEPRSARLLQDRSLQVDSSKKFATMTVNTFASGHLRGFFRRSFRELRTEKVPNLILDLRLNGGGCVGMSTLLTKYISRRRFRVADSLYSPNHSLGKYTRYVHGRFLNNVEMFFISRREKDGLCHIRHLENHVYHLKQNRFDGNVYVLIAGPTFSASALFANAVKGQSGITLAGEETGGGWYGNDGIMIPDIRLPATGLRVRLPLFRLIQFQHPPIKGTGIPPDLFIPTSYDALKKGYDRKMEVVKTLILSGTTAAASK